MKKEELLKAMDKVNISANVEDRILSAVLKKKERVFMSKKKIGIIAAAAVMVMGFTVYAATSGIITGWRSGSSSIPKFTELPTNKECMEELGYSVVLIDEFENGYSFKNASIVNNSIEGENGTMEKFKSIMMRYEKDGEMVLFDQEKFDTPAPFTDEVAATVNDIDIHYSSYNNKFVPPDYELTEEDKIAEKNGDLVFSYGSEDVSVIVVQNLSWEKDGVRFRFTLMDNPMTADELVAMATEIINN